MNGPAALVVAASLLAQETYATPTRNFPWFWVILIGFVVIAGIYLLSSRGTRGGPPTTRP